MDTSRLSLRPRLALRLLAVAALLLWSACKTTEPAPPPPPPSPPPINLADYEDFDPTPYPDEPPARADVQHDVPASLLDGKAERAVTRTVQGYRIQIYSSQDKRAADRAVEEAIAWWRSQRRAGRLSDVYEDDTAQPPVYLIFRQPYYRVRVGNFATRAEALRVMPLIGSAFPNAFIAPDTVTITR